MSIIVKFGQYLYSILTTISLAQNCCSRSSRAFSFSMYSCAQRLCEVMRCTSHAALDESTPRINTTSVLVRASAPHTVPFHMQSM